jgi:hypothetical protein
MACSKTAILYIATITTAYDNSCHNNIQDHNPHKRTIIFIIFTVSSCQNILFSNFRLDFDQFNIAGPEPVDNMCNNDQFIVAGGNPAPAICGINTGNHSEYTAANS